ncbi:MAG: DUF1178 family protein [Defluviimonas sp.]|uniref:DUF1178 family protein n=1 Tax=Albidovulum sp. TaxID=1872424 RepID=UPI001D574A07|nr:DUF1178 family protein [Paracoccaceae bacterium]MCC0064483.1 DUF1178 family protein [Defluviimonas sp.]
MIHYALTCDKGHSFESWFQSSAAFERLCDAGHVTCTACGSTAIEKALMAPAVRSAGPGGDAPALSAPASGVEAALAEMRHRIEESSDYVGLNFAAEARAMHEGDIPERSIWGEARRDEARRLIEDGIPVAPLPFLPTRRTN